MPPLLDEPAGLAFARSHGCCKCGAQLVNDFSVEFDGVGPGAAPVNAYCPACFAVAFPPGSLIGGPRAPAAR